jgi:hypothetical protein
VGFAVLPWADAHGPGYLSWTCNTWDALCLIRDESGTPGRARAHRKAQLLTQYRLSACVLTCAVRSLRRPRRSRLGPGNVDHSPAMDDRVLVQVVVDERRFGTDDQLSRINVSHSHIAT